MNKINALIQQVFDIKNSSDFERIALAVFKHQYDNNQVYKNYIDYLGIHSERIDTLEQIPFLPVELFKNHKIVSGDFTEKAVFTSSGTSGMEQSRHYVKDLSLYEKSFINGFNHFYGDIKEYCILALLPSYLEREGSSLIYMTEKLIQLSEDIESGFYLHNLEELGNIAQELENCSFFREA